MAKLTLNDISGGYQTADAYNTNNTLIEAALENTLSRDGSTPNQMEADIDMNSNDISNVSAMDVTALTVTSMTLNGQAVSLSSSLTGGLDATEVTYDPTDVAHATTTLQAALDDDYLRNDENANLTGTLTASGLVTASAGLDVVGNITVSGTVDGLDLSTVTTNPSAVANHTRAGNIQRVNGDLTITPFSVTGGITEDAFETCGPTGSGATNIIADIDDAVAAGATLLYFTARMSVTTNGANTIASLLLYAAEGDVSSPTLDTNDNVIAGIAHETSTAGGDVAYQYIDICVPVNSSGVFKMAWGEANNAAFSEIIELNYRGFATD